MSEVKYKYQARIGDHPVNTIEKVEVIHEGVHYITVRDSQSTWDYFKNGPSKFFGTWDEAKDALIEAREKDLVEAYKRLERAQGELEKVVLLGEEKS